MNGKTYTIGEVSGLSRVSVRRIRFYSDKGLLPPTARTATGYRVYSEADLARLDLIRALRDAGVSLETIRKTLSRRLTLTEVLRMRLGTLEAEIASRRRIAAVLRATLRSPEPTESDLRRLSTMTALSKTQLREMLENLVAKVSGGAHLDDAWKALWIEAGTPELPDEPTPEQIDAWNEIVKMITDEENIAEMKAGMASMWNDRIDASAYAEASNEILAKAGEAIVKGEQPASLVGSVIAREWLGKVAKLMKRDPDLTFIEWARKHHARSSRYRELLAILRNDDGKELRDREWLWLDEAMKHFLQSAA
ncbi:MAG: MerR family transcriptional regulator [Rhodomicrobium sp.]